MFWLLVFPVVLALFFGSIYAPEEANTLSIGVVDEDRTDLSRDFVEKLDSRKDLEVRPLGRKEAKQLVQRKELSGYVVVPEGFTERYYRLDWGKSLLTLGFDEARTAEQGFFRGVLREVLVQLTADILASPDQRSRMLEEAREAFRAGNADGSAEDQQMQLLFSFLASSFEGENAEERVRKMREILSGPGVEIVPAGGEEVPIPGAYEISFPQAMVWGLLACAAGFATSLVSERNSGTYLRLHLAPLSRVEILAGKALACFSSCMVVSTFLFGLGYLFFDVRPVRPLSLLLGVLFSALCIVGIMMFISTLGKTEKAVGGAGWGFLALLAMFGGGMVPLFIMPEWMQTMSVISPVSWSIYVLEGGIWRNVPPLDLLRSYAVLLASGIAFFGLGWVLFHAKSE